MKHAYIISVLLVSLLIIATSSRSEVNRVYLTGQWQLKLLNCLNPQFTGLTLNTTIPTVLHLDLLRHNKINDPFFGDNYKKLQWVSNCNITYLNNFTLQYDAGQVQLVFEGIDTYGKIKVNDQVLLETNNSFIQYRIILDKKVIKGGLNTLEVQISSTKRHDQLANSKNHMPYLYAQTRKAAYQYSWDWAPYLNTLGIWKPVYLQYSKQIKIDYVWVRNRRVSNSFAVLNFAIALKFDQNTIRGDAIDQNLYSVVISYNDTELQKQSVTGKHIYIDVNIQRPRLWWPNGIGEPNMYNFSVKLIRKSNFNQIDEKNISYGIRTVQLDLKDKKFTISINGHPIYCKGANYVPPDMFYPRTSNPDYTAGYNFSRLLDDAVESNFNMIRVWGGGQYESDQFLEEASRKGIMLFYDFMFSDSIYPSHYQFLVHVQTQITQNVRRARNYPCLVLWSGNNQIYQGILSWGWGRDDYRLNYKRLFEETIPAILQKQHPDVPYIPSSPIYGIGNGGFDRGGDIHFWGVWAAGSLFESYKSALGPFNSQFGTQGIPVWQTVVNFTSEGSRKFESAEFAAHQRHNSQFNTLLKYMRAYGHQPKNFQLQVYLSGLVQAFGVEIAIKYQRISKPKSYGTLYWQFNDAWPAISWSSIDYFGRWKPLQYMAKRSYPDVAVFCADGRVVAVNDNIFAVQALVIVKVQHFNGTLIYSQTQPVSLNPNQVKQILQIPVSQLQNQISEVVVYTEVVAGRNKSMSSTFFYRNFKQLKLDPSAKLYIGINEHLQALVFRTDKFIKNLYISSNNGEYMKFSDNYFDMIAGVKYVVKLKYRQGPSGNKIMEKMTQRDFKKNLVFRSYLQIHQDTIIDLVYE